jgi:hypothetical protein
MGDTLLMKKKIGVILLVVPLLIIQLSLQADAAKASLTDIVVSNTGEDLVVDFRVIDCFSEDMNKAIDSGIDTTFTFFVKIYEKRDLWKDRKIDSIKVSHTIRYDILKKHYELTLSEKGPDTIIVKDFEKAKEMLASIEGLKATSISNLQTDKRYRLWMMAELDKIRLPLHLHYVFFFLSLWDFETDWYIYDFKY